MFRHGAEKGRCHVGVIRHRKSDTLMERLLWAGQAGERELPLRRADGERPVFARSGPVDWVSHAGTSRKDEGLTMVEQKANSRAWMIATASLSTLRRGPYRLRVCSRRGSYRLARLAAKFGPEISLRDLTDRFSYDCLWRAEARSKKGKSACGVYLPDLEQPRPPDAPPGMVKLRLVKKA